MPWRHSEYKHCADAATLRPKWGTHLVAPPLPPFSPPSVWLVLVPSLRAKNLLLCHFWSSMKIYLNTLNAPKTDFTGKEGTLQTWNNESNKNASHSDQTEGNSLLLKTHRPLQYAHLFIHCWTTGIYIQEWSQTGFWNRTMSSLYSNHQTTVTRYKTSGTALGCGETAKSRQKADKSAETVWCYPVNMDQNLWG